VLTGAICCQRADEKFEAGNAFVSGDGRSSRWCIVEASSHRLGSVSVMRVREKCDEKSWEERSGSVELRSSPNAEKWHTCRLAVKVKSKSEDGLLNDVTSHLCLYSIVWDGDKLWNRAWVNFLQFKVE
jgi:hypothetical protein